MRSTWIALITISIQKSQMDTFMCMVTRFKLKYLWGILRSDDNTCQGNRLAAFLYMLHFPGTAFLWRNPQLSLPQWRIFFTGLTTLSLPVSSHCLFPLASILPSQGATKEPPRNSSWATRSSVSYQQCYPCLCHISQPLLYLGFQLRFTPKGQCSGCGCMWVRH